MHSTAQIGYAKLNTVLRSYRCRNRIPISVFKQNVYQIKAIDELHICIKSRDVKKHIELSAKNAIIYSIIYGEPLILHQIPTNILENHRGLK